MIVGAPGASCAANIGDEADTGAVFIMEFDSIDWSIKTSVRVCNDESGFPNMLSRYDRFGAAVAAVDTDTVAVGAPNHDDQLATIGSMFDHGEFCFRLCGVCDGFDPIVFVDLQVLYTSWIWMGS